MENTGNAVYPCITPLLLFAVTSRTAYLHTCISLPPPLLLLSSADTTIILLPIIAPIQELLLTQPVSSGLLPMTAVMLMISVSVIGHHSQEDPAKVSD